MYSIKKLSEFNRQKVQEHFLRLDPESRRSRFCATMNNENLSLYAKNLDFIHNGIFGIFNDNLDIIGLGECVSYDPKNGYSSIAEVAFSIEKPYQGKKLGNKIMQKVVQYANLHNLKELKMYFLKTNAATFHLAKKYNFKLEYYSSEISGTIKVNSISPIAENFNTQMDEVIANFDIIQKIQNKIVKQNLESWNKNISKFFNNKI